MQTSQRGRSHSQSQRHNSHNSRSSIGMMMMLVAYVANWPSNKAVLK